MLLAAYSVLIGFILGRRYRVFVLLPAMLLGGLVIYASSSHALSPFVIFAVLVQIGYLGGSLLIHSEASAARRKRSIIGPDENTGVPVGSEFRCDPASACCASSAIPICGPVASTVELRRLEIREAREHCGLDKLQVSNAAR